ncbi:MAG: CinA family nicotinamide mononucleotide deamidase-related protein [Actinobacteria bacterium]|nr:CinA family nicotinamide mononucleotide deamidase-related protein [Actinomycetota bacterium]
MPPGAPRATVVLTGNELLDGRTRDSNGAFVCEDLSRRGVKVMESLTVADDRERFSACLRHALENEPDLLVLGGGLGTTHDDLTAECLAEVLGVPLEEDPRALAWVEEKMREVAARRRLDFDALFVLARRQARLPAGSTPVPPAGVAPGIAARAGTTRIFAYPGVPYEFRHMWLETAASLERDGFFPDVAVRTVRIFGVGELQVGPVLDALPQDRVELGITVGGGEVTVRLRNRREAAAEAQADDLVAALEAAVPVYSTDGRTVDDLVADGLRSRGATLAVAESCTGGLLGARLTARPGSSDYFVGGVISYSNQAKMDLLGVPADMLTRHGAVSEEVAAAMAEGARAALRADFALSITGVAGPDGGTPEKPVGLVYLGCAGPDGTRVRRNGHPADRDTVRTFSATSALHLLLAGLAP